jgi:hypothetical protein
MSRWGDHSVTLCRGKPGRLCPWCGGSVVGRMTCKRRTCPKYARLWALDWRIVLLENLIAYGGKATMLTITPPGADRLPWDLAKCSQPASVPCSGSHGCVIESAARQRWNRSFQRRLSRLYESAQAATRREVGIRAFVLAQGKEAQRRGATHAHFIVGCESALELRAMKAFRRHLERLAAQRRYEFGHVNGKFVKPKPAREAAAYLSSYFVAGRGHKAPLTAAVTNGELPRMVLYVSRRLTAVTRTTMRNKRRQRHLWACSVTGQQRPEWWDDPTHQLDVIALSLPVERRLVAFARLGRAVIP